MIEKVPTTTKAADDSTRQVRSTHLRAANMYAIVIAAFVLALGHVGIGTVSVCLGVASSVQADIWLAHTVAPIWSGVLFVSTGVIGLLSTKKKTPYLILCFLALSMASLVTAVVSIQLLRLGLVNQTTDGTFYGKKELDVLILIGLGAAILECVVCLFTFCASCRMSQYARQELFKKPVKKFHVQVIGKKDVVLLAKSDSGTIKQFQDL